MVELKQIHWRGTGRLPCTMLKERLREVRSCSRGMRWLWGFLTAGLSYLMGQDRARPLSGYKTQ